MVYCPECGVENDDEAVYCTRCGMPLKKEAPRVYYSRRWDEKEEKDEKQEKHEKDEVYEKADEGGRNFGFMVGLLIILAGAISLLDRWYGFSWATWEKLWPILVIAVGLFIIWNGLKARQWSPRP